MNLLIIAFLAGMLTVLTPCVLPILPVVLGGSLSGQSRWRPLVITVSLVVSIFLFTMLLKASTLLIDIHPSVWTSVAGGVVLLFGLTMMFPSAWSTISYKLGFTKSEGLLQKAGKQEGIKGMLLLGLALGPVFASCSPTYALILAVVLPQSLSMGITALIAYCIGLFVPLALIGYGGRKILGGFRWFANPQSWFRKGLGVLLVVVGVMILTGVDKKLEAAILDNGYFDFTTLEQGLVESLETELDEDKMDEVMDMAKDQEAKAPMLENETPEEKRIRELLNVNYAAPELVEPQNWINSEPLTLAQLAAEDKVVVVDFWTYSCINCIRTLPALRALHDKYADQGLVILGAHAPEFAFERKLENLQREVDSYELEYPIFQDNEYKTWRAYKNRFWPAKYIIDKNGRVRYTHFGEGAYEETEEVIQYLLSEGRDLAGTDAGMIDFSAIEKSERGVESRETYLGTGRHVVAGSDKARDPQNRQSVFVSPEAVSEEGSAYTQPEQVELNQWWLTGEWAFNDERIISQSESASIGLVYKASAANLVLGASIDPVTVEIWIDGALVREDDEGRIVENGQIVVTEEDLYYLTEHDGVEEHTIELKFQGEGVEAYAWTFG